MLDKIPGPCRVDNAGWSIRVNKGYNRVYAAMHLHEATGQWKEKVFRVLNNKLRGSDGEL